MHAVRAVYVEETANRRGGPRQFGDVAAVLLEVVERLGGLRQRLFGQLRQRIQQMGREIDIDPVADAWAAHDVDQPDVLVDGCPAEETALHLPPVVATAAVAEHLVAVQSDAQPVRRQRHAASLGQRHVDSRPLRRDEPPGRDRVRLPAGLDAAAAGEVLAPALELDPQVADRLGVVAPAEHPRLEDPALLAGRVDAALAGGEQERQQHVHRRRLARTVHAAQQQPPAPEMQHLVLVLVDVDDACAVQPPPPTCRAGAVPARPPARRLDAHIPDGTGPV